MAAPLLAGVVLAGVASAQGQPPVVLEAPAACEANGARARMVGEDETLLPGRTARVVITEEARPDREGGLALEVVILEGGETIHRRLLRSSECEALLDAASVIVTLGLTRVELPPPPPPVPPPEAEQPPPEADREAETDEEPAQPATTEPSEPSGPPGAEAQRAEAQRTAPVGPGAARAETAARLEAPALASAFRGPSTSRAVTSARPATSEATSPDAGPDDTGLVPAPFARGGIVSGVAPGIAAVADVGLALVWGAHRVELAGHYAFPTSIGVGAGRIRTDWRAASLRACTSLSAAPLSVCAGLDVGALVGTGEGLDVNRTGASLWLGGRVEGRARWALGHGFSLGVDLAGIAPFQRSELDVDGVGVVHRTGALGVELAVAAEWKIGAR